LTANALIKGGGAGAAPVASTATVDGSGNLTTTGALWVSGSANAQPTLGFAGGNSATVLYAPDAGASTGQIGIGNAAGPTNYHRNTTHIFQNRTASATFAQLDSTGLGITGTISATGTITGAWSLPTTDNSGYCGSPSQGWAQMNAYNYATLSDVRLKIGIGAVPDCLDVVQAIPVKRFKYLPPAAPDPALEHVTNRTHWGFTAQDVTAAMEAAGHDFGGSVTDPESGVQSLSYNDLVAVLWRGTQELTARVAALEAALEARGAPAG
jgi:hypothetical protein